MISIIKCYTEIEQYSSNYHLVIHLLIIRHLSQCSTNVVAFLICMLKVRS